MSMRINRSAVQYDVCRGGTWCALQSVNPETAYILIPIRQAMSETRRGTTACLFSYGQLESKDETEEVTLSAHLLEKPCIDFVGRDVSVSIGLSSVIGSSESARKGRRSSRSVGMAWHVTPPPFN